jgi:chromosome segregation ATPase
MNKIRVLMGIILTIGVFTFIQGAARTEEQKLTQQEPLDFKTKYEDLVKEFDALKQDRDNVLAQTKRLLEGKAKLMELEELQAKWEAQNQALDAKNKELDAQNQKLQADANKLQNTQESLSLELDQLKQEYEKLQKGTAIVELKDKIAVMQKEQNEIEKLNKDKEDIAKKRQEEIDKIKQDNEEAKAKIGELTKRIEDGGKNYKEALSKNKAMEKEVKNIPRKFSEMARQNKMLLKETGEMHYNMGVFYTKNQEYERALKEFEKAVEINSDNAYAYFNLGYIYAEYMVNHTKAVENFRHFLQASKGSDKDIDWVKKYLLTWETYDGKDPIN